LSQIKVRRTAACWPAKSGILRAELKATMQNGSTASSNPVVIVIDDDLAVRNSLRFSLQIEGFAVRAYASGADLPAAAELPRAGCLVVDYYLPGTNGLELLRELRAQQVKLPGLLVTSHPSDALRRQAAQDGVTIIEKPLLGNVLVDGIRAALARSAHARPDPQAPSRQ
jgi:FixJ family two-component response regulator